MNVRLFSVGFLSAVAIGIVASLIYGCATPQPASVIVQAAPVPKPTPIPDPYADLAADEADAIRHHQDDLIFHHGMITVLPYPPNQPYRLNCQPLKVTQIRLAPDETTDKNNVRVGDKNRWGVLIGDHVVLVFPRGTTTGIMINVPGAQVTAPADPNMRTNLVIATSRGRIYTFDPVQIGRPFTEAVSFRYSAEVRAMDAARQAALKEAKQ